MLQQTFALTERALRVDSRSLLGHLMRLIIAGGVMLVLWMIILDTTDAPGRHLLTVIVIGNAVLITVLGPIYFGDCITEEKEEKTLPLLLLADIRPLALLSGKTVPRLLSVVLILGVQLPFTLLAVTLGGVLVNQLLAAYLALAAYLWAIAGVSTLMSVVCRQSSTAIGGAVGLLVLYYVGPGLLILLGELLQLPGVTSPVLGALATKSKDAGLWLYENNLFGRLLLIMESGFGERWEMMQTGQFIFGMVTGCLGFLLAWLSFGFFNRNLDAEVVLQQRTRLPGTSRRVWKWAIVWKDYNFIGGGHRRCLLKLLVYVVLVVGGCAASTAFGSSFEEAIIFPGWLVFLAVWLELQFLLATSFSFELKDQTWSSLAALPETVQVIAYSKVLGTLLAMWPVLAVMTPFALLVFSYALASGMPAFSAEGVLGMGYFIVGLTFYIAIYMHIVVLYAVWSKNRWLAVAGAFFTHYVGSCLFYCILAVPLIFISGLGSNGNELLGILFGGACALCLLMGILAVLHYRILTMLASQHDA